MGHYVHPAGEYWNDYFEYRMYADIDNLPNDGNGYNCICSFYDAETKEILYKSKMSLSNYSLKDHRCHEQAIQIQTYLYLDIYFDDC